MSVSPEEAQYAAREQLGSVAAGFGVADQPADQAQAAQALADAGGQAAAPDVSELIAAVQAQAAQLAALQEQINARAEAEKTADARPPSLLEAIGSSSLGSQVAHLFTIVEERLAALEGHGTDAPAE